MSRRPTNSGTFYTANSGNSVKMNIGQASLSSGSTIYDNAMNNTEVTGAKKKSPSKSIIQTSAPRSAASAYANMLKRNRFLRTVTKANGKPLTNSEIIKYRFSNETMKNFLKMQNERKRKRPVVPNATQAKSTEKSNNSNINVRAKRQRKLTGNNSGNSTTKRTISQDKNSMNNREVNTNLVNTLIKRVRDYPNKNMNIKTKNEFLKKVRNPLTVKQYKELEKKFTNASISAAKAAAAKAATVRAPNGSEAMTKKLSKLKVSELQKLSESSGINIKNMSKTRKEPYITALLKAGISVIPSTKKPKSAVPSTKKLKSVAPSTKKLKSAAPLNRKKILTNMIITSALNNRKKQNLTMKLQTGNVNEVQKNFNALLNPQQNTPGNRVMCKSLLSVYKMKIKNSDVINDETIIKQMMKFNVAFSKTSNSLDNDKSSDKDISLNQYFDVLLIVWMDGVHDGYIEKYFIDWYRNQIKEEIFPAHRQSEIENIARNIVKHNSRIMSNMLEKLKKYAPQIIPGIISGEKLSVPEEVNGYTNEQLTELCKPSTEINKVTKENRLKATSFVKTYYFTNNNILPDRPTIFSMKPGWEKIVKEFLLIHYKLTKGDKRVNKQIQLPGGKGILLSIDQEYSSNQERPLTKLIDNQATTGLLTFGQALDPGSTMLPKLITSDLQGIVLTMENMEPNPLKSLENGNKKNKFVKAEGFIPNAKYYLNDFTFTLTQNGTKVFNLKMDINSGIPNLFLNNKKLIVNQSAGKAGKATAEASKISKFFGDALQYLIFTKIGKKKFTSEDGKVRYPYLSSGDSMMLLGYTVFSEIMGVKPFMIIDFSESNLPVYYPVNLPSGTTFPKLRALPSVSGLGNFNTRSNAF